jgi:hypothetical protein
MSDASIRYIIPKLNSTALELIDLLNKPTLTDNFCLVGCDSAIDYDDNEFPIIGNTKPLAYSYDGITFNPVNDTTLYYISKIDFNGYQWVAGGYSPNYTKSLILSSDGINWVSPVNNVLPYIIEDIVWGQKKWVAIGAPSVNDNQNRVAYSSDGMNWTLSTYNSDNHVAGIACVAYNGSYFLAGGYNYISKSSDGITWNNLIVDDFNSFQNSTEG